PVWGCALRHDLLRTALLAGCGHHLRTAALLVDAGVGVGPAVVAVAWRGFADRDDQAGVGVDDDLHVHRVPIVLRRGGHGAVVGGHQRAVHDQHRVRAVLTGHRR